jgi:hypothetical protein
MKIFGIILWIFLLMLFSIYFEIYFQPIYSVQNSDGTMKAQDNEFNLYSLIATIIGTAVGIAGFGWGIYKHKEEQNFKRKNVIFPLIEEFDKSIEMKYAKMILDNKIIPPETNWKHEREYYRKENLKDTLKYYEKRPDIEPGEDAIRRSFDALLKFFYKLEYLLDIKQIKPKEIIYFRYFIDKVANEKIVMEYKEKYNFPVDITRLHNLLKSKQSRWHWFKD